MQGEINGMSPGVPVRILGVNAVGQESGNASISSGRTLPWLQDQPGMDVWVAWGVNYRDVIILDTRNGRIEAFNLSDRDLTVTANYDALRARLLELSRR